MLARTFLFAFVLFGLQPAFGHSIQYHVESTRQAVVVRVYFTSGDSASYSEYNIFGPGDEAPYQSGRTDANGFLAFVPNRAGAWQIKVDGESTHGMHGSVIHVKVDSAMQVTEFNKPLVATNTKLFMGLSWIVGLAGLLGWSRSRSKATATALLLLLLPALPCQAQSEPASENPPASIAHHGGVSLSRGPGTPIETNSPLTLPKGSIVGFTRIELASFKKFDFAQPNNIDSFLFYQVGAAYGVSDALTASLIVPYNIKRQDNLVSEEGLGDVKLLLQLGFNHSRRGLRLNTSDDTAITLEGSRKTYLALYGGVSFPTGTVRADGDPGLQPGFGAPTYTVGLCATRQVSPTISMTLDVGGEIFTESSNLNTFGNELRANLAFVREMYGNEDGPITKVDGVFEFNLLKIERDRTAGVEELGSGGTILYLTPGARLQFRNGLNVGLAFKIPVVANLNEKETQQGAEGTEAVRPVLTISMPFR